MRLACTTLLSHASQTTTIHLEKGSSFDKSTAGQVVMELAADVSILCMQAALQQELAAVDSPAVGLIDLKKQLRDMTM